MGKDALRGIRSTLGRLLIGDGAPRATAPRARTTLLPADAVVYAIGDVHGCYDQLRRLEDALIADGEQFPQPKHIVMLGDYVDRGPGSAEVLDHLSGPLPDGFQRTCLCGNHDAEMLAFLEDPRGDAPWLHLGSDATLRSYGIDIGWLQRLYLNDEGGIRELLAEAIPAAHVDFLRRLPVMAVFDDVVLVHAGLRPGVPLAEQTDEDLMWIRKPFLETGPMLPVSVVHGHTPVDTPVFERDRISIDTGAFKTGRLSAVRILDRELAIFQTERDS